MVVRERTVNADARRWALDDHLCRWAFGDREDARMLASVLTVRQLTAIHWAKEAWRRFPRATRPGSGAPVLWITDPDGTRWPATDPRVMTDPAHRTGRALPVPPCPGGRPVVRWGRVRDRTKSCAHRAGEGTRHYGIGPCRLHRGNRPFQMVRSAWLVGHAFARELDISPWDALLKAVRIAAGRVEYCQLVIAGARSDLEIEGRFGRSADGLLLHPDTGELLGTGQVRNLKFWNDQLELWHGRMMQSARWAIDAGVAAWQVQRVESEAQDIARVLNATLEELGSELTEEQESRLRSRMRRELLAIESERSGELRAGAGDPDAGVVDSTWREE